MKSLIIDMITSTELPHTLYLSLEFEHFIID